MSELPKGWAEARLTDIINLHDSRRVPLNKEQRQQRQGPYPYYGANGLVDHIDGYLFDGDYVLLAEDGGYFDDPAKGVAYEVSGKFWLNNHAHIVSPRGDIPNRFLTHLLNSINWLPHVGGSTRLKLTQAGMQQVPVPVPPLPEQRRIVAKLDRLRARSSRARHELDRIPKLIERYKQAILAKAFSGELIGLSRQNARHPHQACWDLPKTWRWVRFDEAAEVASNLVPTSEVQQLPHIAPDNIGAGTGKLLAFNTVAEDGVKSPKHRFYPGQVLYSKIRPYLRKAVIIDFEGVCSADMYPLTARTGVVPRYLYYWAFSQQLANFVVDHEGRTVLPKVNQVGLNQTPFPLAPEPDQEAIVKLLDLAFAWLDKIATEHARAEHLLPKLDQAILAKAFRGELVPQDPNDEPASVLLERIRATSNGAEQSRRRRVRSVSL